MATHRFYTLVAQLEEHRSSKPMVAGSSPAGDAKQFYSRIIMKKSLISLAITGFLLTGCGIQTSDNSNHDLSETHYFYDVKKPIETRYFYNKETKTISTLTTIEKDREIYVPETSTAIFFYNNESKTYSPTFITEENNNITFHTTLFY